MRSKQQTGFTIVELLIVIVVIAILAAITIVAYNGIQQRARAASVQSDINQAYKLLEMYYAEHGEYPKTSENLYVNTSTTTARTDANCPVGTQSTDWIPSVSSLPQSNQTTKGAQNRGGCYMYVSDGQNYVLSAWNALESPQTSTLYRRLGFRESSMAIQYYICNHTSATSIGGMTGGAYSIANDYYKYSYTYSNITTCNETPLSGA